MHLGSQPVGLAASRSTCRRDAGLSSVACERGRTATRSPGPAPRENGTRSSGRWYQATSWRSIDPRPPTRPGEPGDDVDDLLHRHVDALLGQRRHRPVADAAGDDVLAHVRHVGGDVEGEAVHRAPAGEAHADRRDLARVGAVGVDPDAGILAQPAGTGQAELGEGVDQQRLDAATCSSEPLALGTDRIG